MANEISVIRVDAVVRESFEWGDSTPDAFIRATLPELGVSSIRRPIRLPPLIF